VTTALYRRYRPENFGEMIGQAQVTDPLMTALRGDRIGHAYLFSGPRGCGKTTSARILARCLNCAEGPTDTPCGVCESCVELSRAGGGSLDVIEIDAASHNGVDDARDLRERAVFAPTRDRYKIFILDEAHMVTPQGFNALLKLVEEPPAHVKFIFATTEPDKVIGTIRSRTHHYPFRLVPPAAMLEYVESLCAQESISPEAGVLPLVVRAGGGSPRDTLSILDQLIAGSDGPTVSYERAVALLGYTHGELLDGVVEALSSGDGGAAFSAVDRVVQTGQDPRRFVDDLLERLRDLIIIAATGEQAAAVLRGTPADELARMTAQAGAFGADRLSRTADIVSATLDEMGGATSPRLQLELMIARVLTALSGRAASAPAPEETRGAAAARPAAASTTGSSSTAPAEQSAGAAVAPASPTAAPAASPAAAPAASPGAAPTAAQQTAAPGADRAAAAVASPTAVPAADAADAPVASPTASSAQPDAAPADSAAPQSASPVTGPDATSVAGTAASPTAPAAEAHEMTPQTGVDPTRDEVPAAGWAVTAPGTARPSGADPSKPSADQAASDDSGSSSVAAPSSGPAASADGARSADPISAAASASSATSQAAGGSSPSDGGSARSAGTTPAAAPAAPASAATPAGPLSLAALREAWGGIVTRLRTSAPDSARLIAESRPAEVRPGDVVMMSFPSERHMSAFRGAPANDLRAAISESLGVQVKYLARVDPPADHAQGDVPPPPDDDPEPGSYDDAYAHDGGANRSAPARGRMDSSDSRGGGPIGAAAQAPARGAEPAGAGGQSSSRQQAPRSPQGQQAQQGQSRQTQSAPHGGSAQRSSAATSAAPVTEWAVAAIPGSAAPGDGADEQSAVATEAASAGARATQTGTVGAPSAQPASGGASAEARAAHAASGAPTAAQAGLTDPAAAPAEPELVAPPEEIASDWGVNLSSGEEADDAAAARPSLASVPGLVSASAISAPPQKPESQGQSADAPDGSADDSDPEAPDEQPDRSAPTGNEASAAPAAPAAPQRDASTESPVSAASIAAPAAQAPAAPRQPAAPVAAPAVPAAPGAFIPADPDPEPEPPEPEDYAPYEPEPPRGPTVQRRQVNVPDGVERRGEAVVRQLLGATFLHEEPYESNTRFS